MPAGQRNKHTTRQTGSVSVNKKPKIDENGGSSSHENHDVQNSGDEQEQDMQFDESSSQQAGFEVNSQPCIIKADGTGFQGDAYPETTSTDQDLDMSTLGQIRQENLLRASWSSQQADGLSNFLKLQFDFHVGKVTDEHQITTCMTNLSTELAGKCQAISAQCAALQEQLILQKEQANLADEKLKMIEEKIEAMEFGVADHGGPDAPAGPSKEISQLSTIECKIDDMKRILAEQGERAHQDAPGPSNEMIKLNRIEGKLDEIKLALAEQGQRTRANQEAPGPSSEISKLDEIEGKLVEIMRVLGQQGERPRGNPEAPADEPAEVRVVMAEPYVEVTVDGKPHKLYWNDTERKQLPSCAKKPREMVRLVCLHYFETEELLKMTLTGKKKNGDKGPMVPPHVVEIAYKAYEKNTYKKDKYAGLSEVVAAVRKIDDEKANRKEIRKAFTNFLNYFKGHYKGEGDGSPEINPGGEGEDPESP